MKIRTLLIFLFIFHVALSAQDALLTQGNPAGIKMLKSTVNKSVRAMKLSVGGGINLPSKQSVDSIGFGGTSSYNLNLYIPLFSPTKLNRTVVFSVGFNIGAEYFSGNGKNLSNSIKPFDIASQTTLPVLVTQSAGSPENNGYKFELGPQLDFGIGSFLLSPAFNVGYLHLAQQGFAVGQVTSISGQQVFHKLSAQDDNQTNGVSLTPKLRLAYFPGNVGFWIESSYSVGPAVTTSISSLVPAGRPSADGFYKLDQLTAATRSTVVRSNPYNSFGVQAGISFLIDKKKKGKPVSSGQDDDCDGMVAANSGSTSNAQNESERVLKTKTKSNQSNDIMQPASEVSDGYAVREKGAVDKSCGSVTRRLIQPDGTIEEFIFACPDDAIYYAKKMNTTVPKQTQGATFGEKMSSGLQKSGLNTNSNPPKSSVNEGARISMNVTVGKQTQGATFGEKVNAGKINITLVEGGCVVVFPNNQAYRVNTSEQSITELSAQESSKVNAGLHAAGGALSQGASLLGGALPGGAIISAAVSSVSTMAGGSGGGAAAASYAATGRMANANSGKTVWEIKDDDCDARVELADGDYFLDFKVVEKATVGLKDTLKTQVRIGFSVENNVLKTKHDTAKNSVGNIR